MVLFHEHVGSKIVAKIEIYTLSRAKLLCSLCHEIPCIDCHSHSQNFTHIPLWLGKQLSYLSYILCVNMKNYLLRQWMYQLFSRWHLIDQVVKALRILSEPWIKADDIHWLLKLWNKQKKNMLDYYYS